MTVGPVGSGRAGASGRNPDHPTTLTVHAEVGPLGGEPGAVQRGVRVLPGNAEGRRRRVGHAGEHLVPYPVGPAVQHAVANQELLLGAVDDVAGERRVGDEPATGELRPCGAVVHQRGVPVDLHPAHRRGLGHGPELRGGPAARAAGDIDGQVRQRAPEVDQREAVVDREAAVVDVDRAVDHDIAGLCAQPGHFGVVADLECQRVRSGPVGARHEQQRVAPGAELGIDLLGRNGVDRGLDLLLGHRRIEHVDTGAERRRGRGDRDRGRRRSRGRRPDDQRPGEQRHHPKGRPQVPPAMPAATGPPTARRVRGLDRNLAHCCPSPPAATAPRSRVRRWALVAHVGPECSRSQVVPLGTAKVDVLQTGAGSDRPGPQLRFRSASSCRKRGIRPAPKS